MLRLWKTLKYLPPGVQTAIKRWTSPKLRTWIRRNFGADPSTIPDRIATVSDGRHFHIGPDWIYWAIHLDLEFEPEATSVVRQLIRPRDTVVDVGANFGWYSTLFAKLAGPTGRVFAFEPVPSTYDRLTDNLERNGLSHNVTAVRSAVGEQPGEVDVYVFGDLSHSCASLSPLDQDNFKTVQAPIVNLDDFLCEQQIAQVDFLKCDVEGSELAVLKGCRRLLSAPAAPIVMAELNADTSRAFGHTKDDIWQFLRDAGYDRFYEIRSTQSVRRVTDLPEVRKLDLLLAAKGDAVERRLAPREQHRVAA